MNCAFEVRLRHLYLPRVHKYVLFLKKKKNAEAMGRISLSFSPLHCQIISNFLFTPPFITAGTSIQIFLAPSIISFLLNI